MYKFNKQTLEFIKIYWPGYVFKYTISVVIIILVWLLIIPIDRKIMINTEAQVIVAQRNEFSKEKLIKLINSLNFPFPDIIMAQAIHETNSFTSSIFIENHNLFGMKCATVRIHTSKGINREHAMYDNWMDSVYDRAFYSATYLSNIKTEDEYYSFLSQSYAEDPEYVNKLKQIVKEQSK